MKVKIKKLNPLAQIPKYSQEGDAGMDLVAISKSEVCRSGKENRECEEIEDLYDFVEYVEYDTGLAIEIPEGYVGLIFPRSSISKTDLYLCNSVAVIDSTYRGSIKLRFTWGNLSELQDPGNVLLQPVEPIVEYEIGDRIGQLIIMPYPTIEFEEGELSETSRGESGFGSTGK